MEKTKHYPDYKYDLEDNIGFGSYCLTNVLNCREQYLEIVK